MKEGVKKGVNFLIKRGRPNYEVHSGEESTISRTSVSGADHRAKWKGREPLKK